jgi:3-hydroxyacyl-[acyl-carrier-protein] dehydratase
MRFLLFDSVAQITKGKSIVGVKCFSLTEEFLNRHFTQTPTVPGPLLIEAMAQLVGWLIIYSYDFRLSTFLALVEDVRITPRLRPGFSAEIYGELVSTSKRDSLGRARMVSAGREIASVGRIIYGHSDRVDPEELARRFAYYSGRRTDQQ